MAKGDAARIRAQLKHPVIDCDGHWQESVPVLLDYMRDLAGPRMADELVELGRNRDAWYKVSHEERMRQRIRRGAWWNVPSDTLDYATSMLPALMRERLDELGIDFAIIYPTYNLNTSRITQSDLRRALSRAYNKMAADIFAPYKDRMTPAAIIPAVTPDEAIDELDYSVNTLGLKVGMFRGALRDKLEDLTAKLSSTESTDRETEHVDDFAASNIHSKGELREEYAKNFYFGCEADDPMTAWAFDRRMGSRLKPVFSSDISHFDVPDMAEVLPEAFELVEKGLIDENDFRDFTFANSARLHGGMNPSFFAGTPVETPVQALLGYPTAVAAGA
jgi:hypothetical protein